jgi:predicted Fe-Mo cluster-binding NifX family protein
MKICFTSLDGKEDSLVDSRFGRCQYLAVFDGQKFDFVKNEAWQAVRGAGVVSAQKVIDLGCQVLITGNIGPNAFYALNSAGVKVFGGAAGKTIKEALKSYQEKELSQLQVPTGRFGFGRHGGGPFGGRASRR